MSQRSALFVVVVMAFMLLGTQEGNAQTAPTSSADEAALRRVVQQVQDGWNAHDGKAFAAAFTSDADYVVVNGARAKGREEIERGHTAIFTSFYKDSRNVATVKSVRFLRPDVAVVHAEWNLEFKVNGEMRKGMP